MKAMLLAAGKGKRMLPLTAHTPKPLLAVGGKALIVWHLEALQRAGVEEVVINHAWLGEQIEARLGTGERFGLHIRYSREGEPLETAGGILRALPLLGEDPFLVISSDVWTDIDLAALRQHGLGQQLAHLLMVPNAAHHPAGDFCLQDGLLRLARPGQADTLTYAGIGLYHPDFFQGHSEGFLPLRPLLNEAIAAGRVSAQSHPGAWYDVGSPERLEALDQQLRQRQEK